MVSGVRFLSGKDIDLKQRRPFTMLVGMLLAIVFIMADPYKVLFAIMLIYCLHGPMMSVWQHQKATRHRLAKRRARARKLNASNTDEN